MDAAAWDERYRSSDLVWGAQPNRWVEQQLAGLSPGTGVDVACGEGRNALWLASRGWRMIAVDFAAAALDKGRRLESSAEVAHPIDWVCDDVTAYRAPQPVDLVLICYLQVSAEVRRTVMRNAAAALAPGGTLLVVGHDSTNLADGTGGPQEPAVLYTAADLAADLEGTGLAIDIAHAVLRPVDGADRPAIDALLRAHRP
ncbi:MAG TPA: class I SAM-dependent methyltransferase [Jatrophihabitantaceae bacterium]|jgi:SAM-dependent methyltransferase|nr:class I SAM-dependent methyltransferase [Jatrophihabitantaceae bacterium]